MCVTVRIVRWIAVIAYNIIIVFKNILCTALKKKEKNLNDRFNLNRHKTNGSERNTRNAQLQDP